MSRYTYGAQSFDKTDDQNGDVTNLGGHGRQKSEGDVDEDRSPNDPLGGKHFGHSSARNLSDYVAPEIGA